MQSTTRPVRADRARMRYGALTAPVLCIFGMPADAQEEAAGGGTIDEVVVTAQRRTESIQDVPIAITAVGEQTLRDSNVKGIEDYFALTPNVSFRSDGSRDRKDLSMRGISNQLNQYANVRPATYAFYIDEFNVVAGTSNPQIVDLERIEVLRGPQGTYFGRNAVGGAINVITKKPDDNWYGELGLDYSSHNTRNGHGVINVPVIDGKLALRASGQIEKSDGWIENINPVGGGNDYDYKTYRAQARLTPTDKLTWDFAYSYSNEETGMRVGVPTGFITATWRAVYYGNQPGDITNPDGVGFYPENDDSVNFNRAQKVGSQYDYASTRAVYEFDKVSLTAVAGRIKSDVFNYGDVDAAAPTSITRICCSSASRPAASCACSRSALRSSSGASARRSAKTKAACASTRCTARRARRTGPKAARLRPASRTARPTTGPRSARRRGASPISGT